MQPSLSLSLLASLSFSYQLGTFPSGGRGGYEKRTLTKTDRFLSWDKSPSVESRVSIRQKCIFGSFSKQPQPSSTRHSATDLKKNCRYCATDIIDVDKRAYYSSLYNYTKSDVAARSFYKSPIQ